MMSTDITEEEELEMLRQILAEFVSNSDEDVDRYMDYEIQGTYGFIFGS